MFLTLKEVRESNVVQIAGCTPDSDRFKALVNEAVQRLLFRGDSSQTVVPIAVCARRGCVVFPRYVANVREARVCGSNLTLKNEYYSFVERQTYDGWWQSGFLGGCCYSSMVAKGYTPIFQSIFGDGRKVRVYAQAQQDYGKTVTIFGTDNSNQPLMHRNADGDWRDGIVLTLQPGYTETEGYVSTIDRVLKDVTQKNVTMYGYNVADAVLEELATYEPSETNPAFLRYQLNLPPCRDESGNERLRNIVALVKLRFIPVEYDSDIVFISNLAALKFMIQAVLSEEGGDDAAAQSKMNKAIQEMNMQSRDENYLNQISVNSNSVGCLITSPY